MTVIVESRTWRSSLCRRAAYIADRMGSKRWTEQSFSRLEREVMIGFFEIRKLLEARKLSDRLANQHYQIMVHRSLGHGVTLLNRHRLDEHYDFSSRRQQARDLLFISNQVIHSYVFAPHFGSSEVLDGVLVSSDRRRNHEAYVIPVATLLRIFRSVGRDSPSHVRATFNPKRGDYDVHAE